jgi:hypothetical protein
VALATRSFRWEGFAGTEDTANHLVGAVLMGVGGVTAMGCTIGQGLSGVSTLALGSFIALAASWPARCWRCAGRPGGWSAACDAADPPPDEADLERRFGGLRRLYGDAGYARLRAARIAVVGLGGVGSWTVEALARSGVAELVLFDLDHVAESNINRQVQALGHTLGQAKTQALARAHRRHPPGLPGAGWRTSCSPTTGRRCCRCRWTC